ncbi:cysteine hydrolase [soil metagenome]
MPEAATHDWFIEQREYERQESRRGRRHAYESLDARRTALVVIDLVPFFFEEDDPYVFGIVPHVNTLAAVMRGTGGLVVWVTPANTPVSAWDEEFFGPQVAARYNTTGGTGPLEERVWHGLEVHDDDLFVEKSGFSAFFPGQSDLPDLLTDRGIDTIVVTGTVTNVCVEGTVRDAATRGWRVVVAGDACSCRRDQDHNASLRTMYRTFSDVRSTDEILGLLRAGTTV